jgi:hypothetical protein
MNMWQARRRNHPTRPGRGRRRVPTGRLGGRERGQAALALVLGLTLILTTGGALLANDAIQHDPLVQNDVVAHFAYRALEAGSNAFISNVNSNPNLINCTASSAPGGQCDPTDYDTWKQVEGTNGPGIVPEWYLWENPVFCFNNPCTAPSGGTTTAQLVYVKVTIFGAAGFPGHIDYQSSTQILSPENGFLTRIWWSNYEATDPTLTGNPPTACTWDWNNGYNGPNVGSTDACSPVYFNNGDQVYGPLYSNDSMYVANDPTLGPVQTADPNCLFINYPAPPGGCTTSGAGGVVNQSSGDAAASKYGQPMEPLPPTDSSLEALAELKGCVYQGPTTITFDPGDQMTVWSQDTPTSAKCLPSQGATIDVPNGGNGNGVIYVASVPAGSCQTGAGQADAGANPFDDYQTSTHSNGPTAQWGYDGTYYNYAGHSSSTVPDCEGDAFVSDATTAGSGVSGQVTVAADNDVMVTGNLTYTDCGSSFNSTITGPCQYNVNGTNDALGLIANNFVEVNHPVYPSCSGFRTKTCNGPSNNLLPQCTSSQLGTPAAALCDPGPNVTIDAAILALQHSFLVNNWAYGAQEGTLAVYGAIDQDWRGAVGTFGGYSSTGYTKDYDWDSRLMYVTPPFYLTPGTPSWGLVSSATDLNPSAPSCSGCGAP